MYILNKKKVIIFILLAIIIFTNSYIISKYTTAFTGSSEISIAKWSVSYDTSDNSSNTLNLISGNETKDYIIKVTSNSEVAANYSIKLSNVPSQMEVKLDNGSYQTPTSNIIEFNNVGTFTGNINTTFSHTLTFNAPLESNISSSSNVLINVIFEQIN